MKSPSCWSVLSLLLLAGLVACTPNTAWVKKGATADELHAAQRDCAADSSRYSFVDSQYSDGMERERSSSAQGDIYRRCMEGMGWKRQRTDQ
jgi:hypothetical protein